MLEFWKSRYNIVSMESCNRLKRLFELESRASGQQEGSWNEVSRVEVKRQCRKLGSTEVNFEEFVALMNIIQYMKTTNMIRRLGRRYQSKKT